MADVKDGGPAFPMFSPHAGTFFGMSLQDYFAAHAPAVPEWFEPVMPPKPLSGAEDLGRWYHENIRQTLIQWPYAWADMQLKVRESAIAEAEGR